jgi:3' exoribonuclease, RNase T-like
MTEAKGTPLRYFLDTEHTDDGERFELISIAIVSDNGREYYAAVDGYDDAAVTPWITENVLPKLPPPGNPQWKSREQIRDEIAAFVTGDDIEFWTMCAWPDWSLVVRLFGRFEDVPNSWPMACWDLWQLEAELGMTNTERPAEPDGVHNALVDARWHKEIHDWLRSVQAARLVAKER